MVRMAASKQPEVIGAMKHHLRKEERHDYRKDRGNPRALQGFHEASV